MPSDKIKKTKFNVSAEQDGKSTKDSPNDGREYHIKKVVIDAGHGGYDSGCHFFGYNEKDNTLAMALKLGAKIKADYPGVEVIYTRDRDVFVELHKRAEIANKAKADLFISIHCNSTDEGTSANGIETYVLGLHRKEDNFEVARRENGAIFLENDYEKQYDGFDPNSNEAYIIFSMYQNAYLEKSILFARLSDESLRQEANRKSAGVKQAGFLVLRETSMPSVLIETGYLNNKTDGEYISSEEGQTDVANAVLSAFKKYKRSVEVEAEPQFLPASARIAVKTPALETPGVVYKVQLAVTSGEMKDWTGKWASIGTPECTKENQQYKYFWGGIKTYDDAIEILKKVRSDGFEGAFVVAFKEGRRVSVEEAKKISGNR